MANSRERLAVLLNEPDATGGQNDSRATSPGGESKEINGIGPNSLAVSRNRQRTYPYFRHLPYAVEDEKERQQNFAEILKHLYVAVEAGDLSPGAVHWTRELRSWLGLKFDPTKEQRIKLVRLYYELSLAPGVDASAAERFASMFMVLTKCVMCWELPDFADIGLGGNIT
jgi:proteasome activator subunit 4